MSEDVRIQIDRYRARAVALLSASHKARQEGRMAESIRLYVEYIGTVMDIEQLCALLER
jgi:hypothetical protein